MTPKKCARNIEGVVEKLWHGVGPIRYTVLKKAERPHSFLADFHKGVFSLKKLQLKHWKHRHPWREGG